MNTVISAKRLTNKSTPYMILILIMATSQLCKSQRVPPLKEGFLEKRQRGRHVKTGSQLKKLKFQKRFCVLTWEELTYSKEVGKKHRGSFSTKRIKIVQDVDQAAFNKSKPQKPEFCFQIGDLNDVIYFAASNATEKLEWMEKFTIVAERNELLQYYHFGIYGSKSTSKWSCCHARSRSEKGCISIQNTLNKRGTSVRSQVSNTSSTGDTESLQNSSSCLSSLNSELDLNLQDAESPHAPPNLYLPDESRSRTGSGESGIASPGHYTKDLSFNLGTSPNRKDLSGSEDEGIDVGQKYSAHVNELKEIKINEQENASAIEIHHFQLGRTLELSRPLTSLTYFRKGCNLISAGFGMMQVWDTASELTLSLQVPGQVISLDSWEDYIAVGSDVIQLIQLNSNGDPRRILYANRKDPILKTSDTKHLVAFVGNEGYLASSKAGGSVINIWLPPPVVESYVVWKPMFTVDVQGSVTSLTASKDAYHHWIAVVTHPNDGQHHKTLHLLDCNWNAGTPFIQISDVVSTDNDKSKICSSFLSTGKHIAVGVDDILHIKYCETGKSLNSKTLGHRITCLSNNTEKDILAVGATNGKMWIFDANNLQELNLLQSSHQLDIDQEVSAISAVLCANNKMYSLCNGTLQVWNDESCIQNESIQEERCVLGMQLCSEGILSQRQILPITSSKQLNLSFEEYDVHLQLPQEALKESMSLEVAFAPFSHTGPFVFPEGMVPISPIVWFCSDPQKKFAEPAIIQLPHCFMCKSLEDSSLLYVLKAEHQDISVDENGQTIIEFKAVSQTQSDFPLDSQHGTLKDNHFCMYCVSYFGLREDILQKVQYQLTILRPVTYPREETKKIYCILHYNLCKKLVEEQRRALGCDLHIEIPMKFQTTASTLELLVDKADAQERGWMVTLLSRRISVNDVNFFRLLDLGTLDIESSEGRYPPRMVLEVSSEHAVLPSVIKLTFTGACEEFMTEIQLRWPRNEHDLRVQDHQNRDGGYGPADRQPRHFNGLVQQPHNN